MFFYCDDRCTVPVVVIAQPYTLLRLDPGVIVLTRVDLYATGERKRYHSHTPSPCRGLRLVIDGAYVGTQ